MKRDFESGCAIVEIRQTEDEGLSAENSIEYDIDDILDQRDDSVVPLNMTSPKKMESKKLSEFSKNWNIKSLAENLSKEASPKSSN